MPGVTIKQRLDALKKATEAFRTTKRRYISKICSVGVRHRWLKYPSLVAAVLFIFFVNALFYSCLWVILNKRKAVGLVITAIAVTGLVIISKDYIGTDNFYRHTEENFVVYKNVQDTSVNTEVTESGGDSAQLPEAADIAWNDLTEIDFAGLKEINDDIVGWIYFENEDISYPILYGKNDEEYINTTYDGQSSREGSIFLESRNRPDFNDFHTIVYGHNMRNLSMFGKLKYYHRDDTYYDGHKYFQIITPSNKYRYEIIAYKTVESDDSIYKVTGISAKERNGFVQNSIMNDTWLDINAQVLESDHIVTLSTCSSGDRRFVVSALRIDEE